jgi:ABC-type sulfate transport system substrate-binding protein
MPFNLNKLKSRLALIGLSLTLGATPALAESSLLNSSYDIAR